MAAYISRYKLYPFNMGGALSEVQVRCNLHVHGV